MSRAAAPTGADVIQLYAGTGLIPANITASELPSPFKSIDWDGAALAAIDSWDNDTRYHPFVSTGTNEARQFRVADAANGLRIIDLKGGIVSDPSAVTVTWTPIYGGTATTMQHATQWELEPFGDLANGRPYSLLRILFARAGIYTITAKWGRSLLWPEDAWDAVRRNAALTVSGEVELAATGTPASISIKDETNTLDVKWDADALAALTAACAKRYTTTLSKYRRISML